MRCEKKNLTAKNAKDAKIAEDKLTKKSLARQSRNQKKKRFNHKEHIEKIVGAALCGCPERVTEGEDLSAMGAKIRIHHEGTKDTKGLEITD